MEDTKKMVLDALSAATEEEQSEGRPDMPILPLVGSANVEVSKQEEKLYE